MHVSECQWTNDSTPVRFIDQHGRFSLQLPQSPAADFPVTGVECLAHMGEGEDKVMANARPSQVAGNCLTHWHDLSWARFARRATV
jgi:hypothetical protein